MAKVLIVDSVSTKKGIVNKDVNAGLGTRTQIGHSFRAKLLEHMKKTNVILPLIEYGYVASILKHTFIILKDKPIITDYPILLACAYLRKKKNALNPKMIHEITTVLNLHKESTDIRVVVISSSGDVFCAGADLEYLNQIKDFSYEENLDDSQTLMLLFKTMLLYPKLMIS